MSKKITIDWEKVENAYLGIRKELLSRDITCSEGTFACSLAIGDIFKVLSSDVASTGERNG